MSASPHKPIPELIDQITPEVETQVAVAPSAPARTSAPAGHEALQALLAFSSLHEQIRQRRAHESRWGNSPGTDVWELEQFVLDEVLQLVAERALTITGSDGIAIALAEDDAIVCRASTGMIAPDRGARLDPNSGFSGACLRSGRIVRSDDTEDDPRVNVEACRRLGVRSLVAVPIAGTQGVMGLLEAFSSETYGFNDSDVRSLSLLAELILAAMKPEEEDRLAQISQRVVAGVPVETAVAKLAQQDVRDDQDLPEVQSQASEAEPVAAEVPRVDFPQASSVENSRPGLKLVLVLVLLAALLGVGLWWKLHYPKLGSTNVSSASSKAAQSSGQPATANNAGQEANPDADGNVAEAQDASGLPRVTGIQHVSSPGSSVVTVELQEQVQYEAHRLSNPERIYVDLHGTALAPGLFGKTIEVGDELLTRVRVAQPKRAVTRVVLETKGSSDFAVSFQSNPSRLVIEVKPAGKEQPKAKPEPLKSQAPLPLAPPAPAASTHIANKEQPGKEEPANVHVPKFRIVLDAGHGGWDLGTVGRKGLLEKDLVVDIVGRLGKLVDKGLGAEIIYTRPDDNYVALEKRAEIANLSHADLFVSVHANYSSDPSARGVETYYTNTYSSVRARTRDLDEAEAALDDINWTNVDIREKVRESRRFASTVQHTLYHTLASQNPEIRNRGVRQAAYVVLTGTTMPAILAEVSFVSNAADERKLRDSAYRQQIAEALYEGITHYAATFHPAAVTSASVNPGGK
jgi:N-acetylmuramoyl-L-alanine amidase